jgi:hypothetical protein
VGVQRLNIFAKGNVDLRDSLLYASVDGKIEWNGINELVRQDFPRHVVRVRHETWTRSDALAATAGAIPEELRQKNLPLGAYPLESQFSRKVFEAPSDVVALSIQTDVFTVLVRHRRDGYLFYPFGWESWPDAERRWLRDSFENVGFLEVAASMEHLSRICQEIRARSDARILIYNLSAAVPGDAVHCYQGLGEVLSARIRRFNLALVELSERLGISVVDVDTVVARAGAERVKIGLLHLTPEGNALVAREVTRILQDLGCFD